MVAQARPLIEVFAEIPDFRGQQGKRYELKAILALACSAMLCGYRSYGAISQWGRNYGQQLVQVLGFKTGQTPCAATFNTVFRQLDWGQFEAKLNQWVEEVLSSVAESESGEAISLDGKTLRGSRKQGAQSAHLLSALSARLGLTLRQQAVEAKTNEIGRVSDLLKELVLEGRVFTMDALLTQEKVAEQIVEGGGDYVMIVKGNQPSLQACLAALFETPSGSLLERPSAQTLDQGHGRIEQRKIECSTSLTGYGYWPGLEQVFRLERNVTIKKTDQQRSEVVYGVTSLSPKQADASRLLSLVRGHWAIENGSHWVRDVTFDEDRSQVRVGNIPQVMASFRNLAIGLLRQAGETNIAAACRRMAAQPWSALALIGITQKTE